MIYTASDLVIGGVISMLIMLVIWIASDKLTTRDIERMKRERGCDD